MTEAARAPSLHDIAPASHPMRRAGDQPPPQIGPEGWAPAHHDESTRAADWRARAAMQASHDNGVKIATLEEGLAEVAAALRSVVRVLKVLGALATPGVIAIVVDFAKGIFHWLVTFHH
jgi:hypothetical protein